MEKALEAGRALYGLEGYETIPVPGHPGGRNRAYICRKDGENRYVLRVSALGDRTEEDYLAEAEFVRYLARNGGPVADVFPSARGRLVEKVETGEGEAFLCLFAWARGELLWDRGYRYRDGAPLEEYFYNTGRTLGAIHRLSKAYAPAHGRPDYFDKYNMDYIHRLIPDGYAPLKRAIASRLEEFRELPRDPEVFGLVHFDYSDGNYHIDMDTGEITVYDFDNCMYCWYMFDLANLWPHGEGWFRGVKDPERRRACMRSYFDRILEGYRSETEVSEELLARLPLFIDMVLIENIVDEFEVCARAGEEVDEEDIGHAARCLIQGIPYAGIGVE